MSPVEFRAPWGRGLRVATIVSVILLFVVATAGWIGGRTFGLAWNIAMIGIALAILFATLPFMVLGYRLTEDEIQIKRLGWMTTLPLAALMSVKGEADAMQDSIPLFSNSGLFSLTGYFWNRQLKLYRAFATDPSRAVVLRYPNRTIVITPHDPQHFIVRARTLMKTAAYPS